MKENPNNFKFLLAGRVTQVVVVLLFISARKGNLRTQCSISAPLEKKIHRHAIDNIDNGVPSSFRYYLDPFLIHLAFSKNLR